MTLKHVIATAKRSCLPQACKIFSRGSVVLWRLGAEALRTRHRQRSMSHSLKRSSCHGVMECNGICNSRFRPMKPETQGEATAETSHQAEVLEAEAVLKRMEAEQRRAKAEKASAEHSETPKLGNASSRCFRAAEHLRVGIRPCGAQTAGALRPFEVRAW